MNPFPVVTVSNSESFHIAHEMINLLIDSVYLQIEIGRIDLLCPEYSIEHSFRAIIN